ncbi:MAG: chromosomal replication initiator protein DnaA [Planctomycetota bacterium]|nr:MAG: chromosomal replication initiator protein DnaA [Planctomycetota bacterium]
MYIPRTDTITSVQDKIAEKLGPQRYKVWFKNATQFTMAEGCLKVSTPNAFICGWIERHYSETISEAVREVTGADCQLSFVVDPKLLNALKKRQLDSQAEFIAKNPERMARQYRRQGLPPPRKLKGRFEDFVVGPANELAVSVVRKIADRASEAYSPVFVHGGCGVGKTHLLNALGNELTKNHPQCQWAYLTGDEFTNAFVLALRSNKIEGFRQRYRNLDALIIDDVHFLANKKATQEEFLHTFNAIDAQGKHIVLASDSHPKLIGPFSEKLINRFVAGMVVRIDMPDLRMRSDILRLRAKQVTSKPIPAEVIQYIAEHLQANVRELEGALLKLVMFSTISHQPITLSLARRALADHLERTQRALGLDEIDQTVATYFGLTPADLHTSRKTRTIALARGIAMHLARKHTEMSFPEIGRFMGNKNHSTVILANRKIEKLLKDDAIVSRQTPAGISEERLRDIVQRVEEQLGRYARGGSIEGGKVQGIHVPPTSTVANTKPDVSNIAVG